MQKPIVKHKAKTLDGEWVYGSYLFDTDWGVHRIVTGMFEVPDPKLDYQIGVNAPEVDPDTICQFTGRNDKDGQPVYGGDILFVVPGKKYMVVKWSWEQCKFYLQDKNFNVQHFDTTPTVYKVCGSSFDNKELLKE